MRYQIKSIIFTASLGLGTARAAPSITYIVADLLDVRAGAVKKNQLIVVKDSQIQSISDANAWKAPAEATDKAAAKSTVLRFPGKVVMPGMIDVHTHLLTHWDHEASTDEGLRKAALAPSAERIRTGEKVGGEYLAAGITTVRDVGNSGVNQDLVLREIFARGEAPGPRLYGASMALSTVGGQFSAPVPDLDRVVALEYRAVSTPDEAAAAVKAAADAGANLIKVIINNNIGGEERTLSPEIVDRIVGEAHKRKLKVAAHCTSEKADLVAAGAGVDSIEHLWNDPGAALPIVQQKRIFWVPTNLASEYFMRYRASPSDTPEEVAARLQKGEARQEKTASFLRKVRAGGVRTCFGSDEMNQVQGWTRGQSAKSVYREYVRAGMTPLEILQSFTLCGADLIGDPKLGEIRAGNYADLIALDGNPLENISALEHVIWVMKAGRVYPPVPTL